MSKTLTVVATIVIAAASLAWAALAKLSTDQWLVMLQSLGTLLALLWVIYTGLLQERTSNRDILLSSLDLIKADLEDLTKSIETEMDKLGSKTASYAERYANGERTAYIAPMTADNGRRLRALYASAKVRTPQLERRLNTYVTMFRPLLAMAEDDPVYREVIESCPHGRAYLAIKAALAPTDDEAKACMAKLARHDMGPAAQAAP